MLLDVPVPPRVAAELLVELVLRRLGGKGSGNFGHAGRKGEVGGSESNVSESGKLSSTQALAVTRWTGSRPGEHHVNGLAIDSKDVNGLMRGKMKEPVQATPRPWTDGKNSGWTVGWGVQKTEAEAAAVAKKNYDEDMARYRAVQKTAKDLEDAVNNSTLTKETTFYRSVGGKQGIAGLKVGDVFTDKGFVATTTTSDKLRGITQKYQMAVTVPKGTKMLDVVAHQPKNYEFANEREHLLGPGHSFQVTASKNGVPTAVRVIK